MYRWVLPGAFGLPTSFFPPSAVEGVEVRNVALQCFASCTPLLVLPHASASFGAPCTGRSRPRCTPAGPRVLVIVVRVDEPARGPVAPEFGSPGMEDAHAVDLHLDPPGLASTAATSPPCWPRFRPALYRPAAGPDALNPDAAGPPQGSRTCARRRAISAISCFMTQSAKK